MPARRLSLILCMAGAVILIPLVAACSRKSTAPASPGSGASATAVTGKVQTGSDAEFVRGLCVAAQGFVDEVTKATDPLLTPQPGANGTPAASPDLGSAFFALFEAIAPAYGTFADKMSKLKPPSDLADWFQHAQPQMAAAAKALKEGNFADPSLKDFSTNPFPPIPDGPRARLQGVAATTKACDGLDVFSPESTTGGFGDSGQSVLHGQKTALKSAATGTWTGPYGTLKFNSDATADFNIKLCGISSDSTNPFGVDDSCDSQAFKGKLTVDDHGFEIGDANGGANVLPAYIDDSGKLHVGVGTLSELADDRTGTVDVFAESSLTVKNDGCEREDLGSSVTKPVPCKWVTENGQQVLQFTNERGDTDELIWVPGRNLLVAPEIFVAAYSK